jgi:hypothetical protein
MDQSTRMAPQTSLFQVYLRLRPPTESIPLREQSEQWLILEPPVPATAVEEGPAVPPISTHVTLQPPNDSRKRAVERFNFTKIFKEEATQLDVFEETGVINAVRSLIHEGRDGLLATLGVTGSGKVGSSRKRDHRLQAYRILESYHPRLSKSAGVDTDDFGRSVSVTWSKHPSRGAPRTAIGQQLSPFPASMRPIRSSDNTRNPLPGIDLRRL